MKRQIKYITLLTLFSICLVFNHVAQPGSPPPPPPAHGQSGNQGGGNAPLGGGIFLLLLMSGGYGIFKLSKSASKRKKDLYKY